MLTELLLLAAGVVLTIGTGFFVAAEFALVNLDRADLEARAKNGEKGLDLVIGALKITSTHLSSAQLGITLTTLLTGYTLEPGDADESKARIREFRKQRMEGSPNKPSCGSTFKRPPGDFPGRVIEAAGLKGTRVGQIEVSPVHANYLVNHGGGTARDALKLIETVRETVREKLGIELESEVRVIGEA